MDTIGNRYEILFLYEACDCNPNGDPLDENRPRTDPETGEATVTDVRIKRTIRDYILAREPSVEKRLAQGMEILIRDTFKEDGCLCEGKDRAAQFASKPSRDNKDGKAMEAAKQAILGQCIDARLFGAALPLGKGEASLQLTGPAQFMPFNRSLHRVAPVMVQQTAAFASKAGAHQKSFAERWLVPYALIAAYGVVNETAARTTGMTESDLAVLLEALWHGTASLNSHSKIGHEPLLLVVLKNKPGHRIGRLSRRVELCNRRVEDTAIRSTNDYELEVGGLVGGLADCGGRCLEVLVKQDPRLKCRAGETSGDLLSLLRGVPVRALEF